MGIKEWDKKDKKKLVGILLLALLLIAATILLFPLFQQLADDKGRQELIAFVHSKGAWGVFILLGLQLLQVVVAVIPGEVVEVVSGMLYGTIGGWAICTVGVLLSSMLVFFTVRKLGAGFVEKAVSSEKMKRFHFLHNAAKLESIIFLLFFIPGTPKDILTYVVPLTEVKPARFFLITSVARIPSIVSSTYAGATISDGNWRMTILIFAITGVVGLAGIFFNEKVLQHLNRRKQK
jgi:uncharacterized membrane protein YdjX (TVP38/TMEM64 family)